MAQSPAADGGVSVDAESAGAGWAADAQPEAGGKCRAHVGAGGDEMSELSSSLIARFWEKVDMAGDCWLWTASVDRKGYGQIQGGSRNARLLRAHRVSWEIHYGANHAGFQVCHRCDVRRCVRPDHLFLGTNDDNVNDMHAKGRDVKPPRMLGVQHPHTTFSEEDIRWIRKQVSSGVSQRALARHFNVCFATINHIWLRRNWGHVV